MFIFRIIYYQAKKGGILYIDELKFPIMDLACKFEQV